MSEATGVTAAPALSRRERVRASTLAEIKACAFELMRERGTTQVNFSDIARAMGMTAPALYRYFADRDDLLTALIRDAYTDLGTELAKAVAPLGRQDDWGRFHAGLHAYRRWGVDHPERFELVFGLPVPGFVVDESAGTTEAAKGAMGVLQSLVVDAHEAGRLNPPVISEAVAPLAAIMAAEAECGNVIPLPPEVWQGVLHAWLAVHGFVSLESVGHLTWWPAEACEALFEAHIELAARAVGIRPPQAD